MRGIGPCYRDKVGRSYAVRLGDMLRPDFKQKIERIVEAKKKILSGLSADLELDAAAIYDEFSGYADRLKSYVGDTTSYLLDSVEAGKRLLFEGAQGALLDVDHGTYPFVTSSNSSGVGISSGSGIPARWLNTVIGVAKAYSTRVGGGPFPTEQNNDVGQKIRDLGHEYGTTTGRPRRCGWFDAVAVRYTSRLSGIDSLSLMMMDVVSQLPEIKVCVAYELDGQRIENFPSHVDDLRRVQPVYETLPGWMTDVTKARKMSDLPGGALKYIQRISELVGRPVSVVSVGPGREQTIFAGA
jgi:adenylosuccinate synthase